MPDYILIFMTLLIFDISLFAADAATILPPLTIISPFHCLPYAMPFFTPDYA